MVNIGDVGNTAAASVLLTLGDLLEKGTLAAGSRVLLGAFGAGLTWCAAVLEWGVPAVESLGAPRAWPDRSQRFGSRAPPAAAGG
jgi:hypothetical protein